MPSPGKPLNTWRKKVIGFLIFIAVAPVLLTMAADLISKVLGVLVPYLIVLLALGGIYGLVFGRRPP